MQRSDGVGRAQLPGAHAASPPLPPPSYPRSGAVAAPGLSPLLLSFGSTNPSQQCLWVSIWSVALLGVAFPLLVLQRIERRRRA